LSLQDSSEGLREISPGVWMEVQRAAGSKCARCWQWEENISPDDQLCTRCKRVIAD